jgi:hypothetical protein
MLHSNEFGDFVVVHFIAFGPRFGATVTVSWPKKMTIAVVNMKETRGLVSQ